MIKDILKFIAVVGVLMCLVGFAGYTDTHYKMNGEITTVFGHTVIVTDTMGERWEIAGDGYTVGQNVTITFFSNCTDDTRYDDEVVGVR